MPLNSKICIEGEKVNLIIGYYCGMVSLVNYSENYQKHACRWFSPGTPVSSTNETGRPNITEMLLKVVLNTVP
jgi:hypothetical protein